jgi:hypothetical protein
MQSELDHLSTLFFSSIGELQRDAGPASISGEELISSPSTSYDAGNRALGFSDEILATHARLEALITSLPDTPVNKAHELIQMERIKELQRLDEGLTTELQWEVQSARSKLEQIQEIFAALCRHELEVRKLKGSEGP